MTLRSAYGFQARFRFGMGYIDNGITDIKNISFQNRKEGAMILLGKEV